MAEEKITPEEKIKKSIRYTKDGVEIRSLAAAFLKDINAETILYYGKKYYFGRPTAVVASFFIADFFGPDYSGSFLNYLLIELGLHELREAHLVHLLLLLILLWLCSQALALLYKIGSAIVRYCRNTVSRSRGRRGA